MTPNDIAARLLVLATQLEEAASRLTRDAENQTLLTMAALELRGYSAALSNGPV